MSRTDCRLLLALQALVLGLPLFLGGRHPWGVALGDAIVVVALIVTLRERRRRSDAPRAVGIGALAGFVALALVTTIPLPPSLLEMLSPAAARLYAETLPGWPGSSGWSAWRPLALDPYGAWLELCKLSIGLGTFAVIVAFPWQADDWDVDPRAHVFGTLLLTLLFGGAGLALLGLVQELAGNGQVLWLTAEETAPRRASGPFVNPNHFAGWLEMVIPVAVAYCVTLSCHLVRRIAAAAGTGRRMGVRARRAWAGALLANQRRLWLPLLVAAAAMLMGVAHVASGSRGGMVALLFGLGALAFGLVRGGASANASRRWASRGLALALLLASAASLTTWARLEQEAGGALDENEASLFSRIAVAAQGREVVREYAMFGAGLGSWQHAFRRHQEPPVESGIWDHAHDDFLELAAESGAIGVGLAVLFGIAVYTGATSASRWRAWQAAALADPASSPAGSGTDWEPPRRDARPPGFEIPEWRAAFAHPSWLRWGLAGGAAAILVHSAVDFGLRMPANLLCLMVLLGLLVLSAPARPARSSWAVGLLLLLLIAAFVPPAANALLDAAGRAPISARDLLERADLLVAEGGDRETALALVRRAVDWSPADRAGHEEMASVLGAGPESEAALERALWLQPWAAELRDQLAAARWQRGEAAQAANDLEESVHRFPYLVSHTYPTPAEEPGAMNAQRLVRYLAESSDLRAQLEQLDPALSDAVERGLRRGLAENPGGRVRLAIVDDLVMLLEARGRFAEAAELLRAEAPRDPSGAIRLARAAQDFLESQNDGAARAALHEALALRPENGDLYRRLAVDVYAARGDFDAADEVLRAGQRNSDDLMPLYRGMTDVLAMREAARVADLVARVQVADEPRGLP